MKPQIYKLERYPNDEVVVCPFCLMNPSMGQTDYGFLGCRFCQAEVDKVAIEKFTVVGG